MIDINILRQKYESGEISQKDLTREQIEKIARIYDDEIEKTKKEIVNIDKEIEVYKQKLVDIIENLKIKNKEGKKWN